MTLAELRDWATEMETPVKAKIYLDRLQRKTDYFCRMSCEHLSLCRNSNTLSGGEQQRLRICAMLNSSVNRLCYLLDEPTSGLHTSEVEIQEPLKWRAAESSVGLQSFQQWRKGTALSTG